MGQIIIQYPNANALRIYYALIEHFHVPREVWDDALGANRPKTNAELKVDVDAAIRQFLVDRVKGIERRDAIAVAGTDVDDNFENPELTE